MSKDKLTKRKSLRLTENESDQLAAYAKEANMTESDYLRFLITRRPADYSDIKELLGKLINEVNHIGNNINQIVYSYNAGYITNKEKEHLNAYMIKVHDKLAKVVEYLNK